MDWWQNNTIVSVPSRGIRVINEVSGVEFADSYKSFRPLSGNKGNQLAMEVLTCLFLRVSVPSRGIRVINCMDKTKSDL